MSGVRSSCETLATNSRRMRSSCSKRVTSRESTRRCVVAVARRPARRAAAGRHAGARTCTGLRVVAALRGSSTNSGMRTRCVIGVPASLRRVDLEVQLRGVVAPGDALAVEDHHAVGQRARGLAPARERRARARPRGAPTRGASGACSACSSSHAPVRARAARASRRAPASAQAGAQVCAGLGRPSSTPSSADDRDAPRSQLPAPSGCTRPSASSRNRYPAPRTVSTRSSWPLGDERVAQPPDVDVHRAVLDEHVVAPDVVEDLRRGCRRGRCAS